MLLASPSNGKETVKLIFKLHPDVALLGIDFVGYERYRGTHKNQGYLSRY